MPDPAPLHLIDHLDGFALDAEGWRPRDRGRPAALLLPCRRRGRLHDGDRDGRATRTTRRRSTAPPTSASPSSSPTSPATCVEDHGVGRCYLPADWLAEPAWPRRSGQRPLPELVGDRRAASPRWPQRYEASARVGAARLPFRVALGGAGGGAHLWRDRPPGGRASARPRGTSACLGRRARRLRYLLSSLARRSHARA